MEIVVKTVFRIAFPQEKEKRKIRRLFATSRSEVRIIMKIEVETENGKSLLAFLREQQIYIDAPCNGKGNCGRCLARFLEGAPEPTEKEKRLLSKEELSEGMRLACAAQPQGKCVVELPSRGETEMAALVEGRTVNGERTAALVEGRTVGRERTAGLSEGYGVAIDIGTTTLAASLLHLAGGRRICTASAVNHQRAYGADVISRIQAACDGAGEALRQSICADIGKLIEKLIEDAQIAPEAVREIVIAGNTTMCHLLRGLSCAGLGAAPFTPEDISLWEGSTKEFPELFAWDARMTVLPGISAFVGADIVAGIYGSGMDLEEANLFLDIGTNGEMAIGGREGFLVTSAAAGPVFEGGNIECGVPGVSGAVAKITLELTNDGEKAVRDNDGDSEYSEYSAATEERLVTTSCETIGGSAPIGLCGTGIIDVMGELVRLGLVDENGTLREPWFTEGVPLAGGKIRFTEGDIRQLQMGKAAIRAGIETLLEKYGGTDIGKIYVAGGFGSYLNVEQAIRIGMFPESFAGRVEMLGNSALAGAERFLLGNRREAAERMERIIRQAAGINLAMDAGFNERYLAYMFFRN